MRELIEKLNIDVVNKLKRPVHRIKKFEISELSINHKQSKKDRLTLVEAWFGNIPITLWNKNTLEYEGILPTRLGYNYDKVTLPFNYKKYKYKIEPLLTYPQFRYRADSKTYVGFTDYDSFIILYNEDRPLFIGSSITSSYANIYNPVWQECSLDLVKELIEIKAWKVMQDNERLYPKIYNEERANGKI